MFSSLLASRSSLLIAVFFFVASMFLANSASAAMFCGYNDTAGKFANVSGACRATIQDGEFDVSNAGTYFFDKNINFSCPNASCMVKSGNEFCNAVAKMEGKVGTFACMDSASCVGAPLSQSAGSVGSGLCTGNQACCVAKTATASPGASTVGSKTIDVPDPLGGVTIPALIGNVIRIFSGIAGSIALVIFVFGGFSYITSGGESAKVKSATMMLRNGAIGVVMIFGAYFFTATIINLILVQNK